MHKNKRFLFLLSILIFVGVCGGVLAEPTDQPALTDVRCYFEHSVLPRVFYSDPLSIIGGMNSDSIFKSWMRIATDFGYADRYDESDFKVIKLRGENDDLIMAMVILPAPTEAPECYRLYLCYDMTTETALYLTNEYEDDMEGWGLIGLWTPEEEHHFVYLLRPLDGSNEDAFTDSLRSEVDQIFWLVEMNRTESLTE